MVLGTTTFAASNSGIPMGEIRQACAKYLNAYTTTKDIKKMEEDDLAVLADEQGLDPDDYSWDELRAAVIEELGL